MDDVTIRKLVKAAREAAQVAWAPYSGYRVGAALLTASGQVVSGCNVENSSSGLSMCAERVAAFAARAAGLLDPEDARPVAVAVHSANPEMPWPCGACRQVLHDLAGDGLEVIVDGSGGRQTTTLAELLPNAFRLDAP